MPFTFDTSLTNNRDNVLTCQIRLTMAAIDPSEAPEADENGHIPAVPRATLKLVKSKMTDDDLDEEDDSYLEGLLNGEQSDEDDEEESDEEANGGPSDPAKSKKARQEAAIMKLIEAAQKDDSDDDMENAPNGTKSKKGKAKASDEDEEDSEEESDESEDLDLEQFVVCTLDTERVSSLWHSSTTPLQPAKWYYRTTNKPSTSPLARMRRFSSRSLVPTASA